MGFAVASDQEDGQNLTQMVFRNAVNYLYKKTDNQDEVTRKKWKMYSLR